MDPRDDLLTLDNQLCFALVTAARNVVALYRPVLEPLGLTHPQYLVMLALWEGSPRSLGELADALAMEPATLSPLVKRLESQGRIAGPAGSPTSGSRHRADRRRARPARRALEVPGQIMQRTGMDAAALAALRDGLIPFAGGRAPAADALSRSRAGHRVVATAELRSSSGEAGGNF